MNTKYCGGCSKNIPLEEWSKNKTKTDGLATQCKNCVAIYRAKNKDRLDQQRRDYYWNNPDKYKADAAIAWRTSARDKQYGLAPGSISKMLVSQSNKCANHACASKITWETSHLDHCHKTGKVRGLLCKKCNWTLGYANDDPNILLGLVNYLEEV